MNIKTTLKSSVAAAALFAIAAPVAPSVNAADDTLKSGNKNSLKLSGFVARSLWYGDDSLSDGVFNTDGSTSTSRLRWIASGTMNENVTAGAMVELALPLSNAQGSMTLNNGTSNDVSGTEVATNTNWGVRHTFVWVNHKRMGKVSLGQTNSASNGRSETSFSATNMADLSSGTPLGDGISFIDTTRGVAAPSVSGVTVGAAFTNLDGRSRTDVLRYDTPRFSGLGLATSLLPGGDWDIAADYKGKAGAMTVRVQAQYNSNSATSTTVEGSVSASGGFLHDSGLNGSVAHGRQQLKDSATRGSDPKFWWGQVGYRTKIFGVGGTNFAFNWNHTTNLATVDSEGDAIGFTISQIFNPIGANMALIYRNYSFDSDGGTFEDVDVFGLQTVFNF